MDPLGLEPRASACFAKGTFVPSVAKAAIFQLIYEPSDMFSLPTLVKRRRPNGIHQLASQPSNHLFIVLAVFRLPIGSASRSKSERCVRR